MAASSAHAANEDEIRPAPPVPQNTPRISAPAHNRDRRQVLARINQCAIEKIMAGDGSVIGDKEFKEGEFFAATSWHNNLVSLYPIEISSYRSPAWKNTAFTVHAESDSAKAKTRCPAPLVPRIHKSNYRRATTIIRNKVREWCLDHPGFSLSKRGPGARGRSSVAASHYI